jgi:hypothetical protein
LRAPCSALVLKLDGNKDSAGQDHEAGALWHLGGDEVALNFPTEIDGAVSSSGLGLNRAGE